MLRTRAPLGGRAFGASQHSGYGRCLPAAPGAVSRAETTRVFGVEHHIVTVGPPLFMKARWLDGAKLVKAKEEFATMERLGIVRRSKSPWASVLLMVPKKDGGWRSCGDCRRLNEVTTLERYPVPV